MEKGILILFLKHLFCLNSIDSYDNKCNKDKKQKNFGFVSQLHLVRGKEFLLQINISKFLLN